MPLPSSIQARVAELAADNISGATSVAQKAAGVFLQLVDPQLDIPDAELSQHLSDLAFAIVRAQPTMAPLITVSNRVLQSMRRIPDIRDLRDHVRGLAGAAMNQMETSTARIALHAQQLITKGMVILTHSHSSAVQKTLVQARDAGTAFSIVCTESRPMLEGVELARELAQLNIPTTIIADAAMAAMMPEVHMVLVGADSVSSQRVVNKVGTRMLCQSAQAYKIPVYVLCGSEKFLPDRLVFIERSKGPGEILPDAIAGVSVRNVYYDSTPLELISGLVTEEGLHSMDSLKEGFAKLERDFVLRPEDFGS